MHYCSNSNPYQLSLVSALGSNRVQFRPYPVACRFACEKVRNSEIQPKLFGRAPFDVRIFLVASGGILGLVARVKKHCVILIDVPDGSIGRKSLEQVVVPVVEVKPSVHILLEEFRATPRMNGFRGQESDEVVREGVQMHTRNPAGEGDGIAVLAHFPQ